MELRKEKDAFITVYAILMAFIFLFEFFPSVTLKTPPAAAIVFGAEIALHIGSAVIIWFVISVKAGAAEDGARKKLRTLGLTGAGLLLAVFLFTYWLLTQNMLCANFFRISMIFWLVALTLTGYWWIRYRED